MAADVCITEYTDPGCPWAYSAEPFRRRLSWLYGERLEWRVRMVGLREPPDGAPPRGPPRAGPPRHRRRRAPRARKDPAPAAPPPRAPLRRPVARRPGDD